MKFLKSSAVLIVAISMTPALAFANNTGSETAHERCKRGEDNRQVLGGLAGAVVGGVFGSQVSGNGARTEGSAIGAVLGGLAGVGIADKTIDCDPVYETQNSGYSSQPTSQYGTTQYGSTGYSGTSTQTGSQPYYEDRVTVSNHPVYSDPYYGAGGVSQGNTYSTGTVTYPPSGNNSQYGARTYAAPTEVVRAYSAPAPVRTYAQPPRAYTQAQPVTQSVVYTAPRQTTYVQPRTHRTYANTRSRTHYHGRHSCNMGH